MTSKNNTAEHKRHRIAIRKLELPCGICGLPIDYTLTYPHLESFVVDHIIPLAKGGHDTIDNKQPAHSRCNRAKSDKVEGDDAPRTFVTARSW